MKKIGHMAGWVLLLATLFTSCGKEDALTPDYENPSDHFQPAADDTSEEAQLRRQFFGQTGCYLLFNDTIQREYLGTDINGDPRYFVETLDMTYSVGQSSTASTHYAYTYLGSMEQKRMAAAFLNDYVLPHLTKVLRPYSWFVCNVISSWTDTSTSVSKPYAISNQRCIAIAGNYLIQRERTDQQKEQYAQRILNIIIGQLAMNHNDAFTEFYKFSTDYYSRDYMAMGYAGTPSKDELYRMGFLSSTSSTTFPSTTTDLYSYALLAIQYDDEQLEKTYGDYPIILQKATIVRTVLIELGYVF
ncbi:MAG: hypothetical protein IJP82_07530 [Bacteroidaceae bacterium]|nr:hypothetical protein [Bacteroidaceae bacterium]